MAAIKTDNSYLLDKARLRAAHLPPGDVRVLDAFGGRGLVWACVERISGRSVQRTAIDNRMDLLEFHLHGDNLKVMAGMNLHAFNVIDLDAYGVPYEHLCELFAQNFKGTVFVTFIQSMTGRMPDALLREIGFGQAMIEKSPALLCRRGWDHFKAWLALRGVDKITHRSKSRKHYLYFQLC